MECRALLLCGWLLLVPSLGFAQPLPAPTTPLSGAEQIPCVQPPPGSAGAGYKGCTAAQVSQQAVIALGGTIGPASTNPYAGPYPAWINGLGGTGYPNTHPLGINSLYLPNGSVAFANQYPYGDINTGQTLVASINANRPGCVQGFLAPTQVGVADEFGASALCANGDTVPVLLTSPGTFASTTFTPTTPIPAADFPMVSGNPVAVPVGMWIRTNDNPAYDGQITSWTVNGSNQVTAVTVSGWVKRGTNTFGTPSGTSAYFNPQDKIWNLLDVLNLNTITVTGNLASNTTVSSVSKDLTGANGIIPNGSFIADTTHPTYIPANTVITALTSNSFTLSQAATNTVTGDTLVVTLGSETNKSVAGEIDLQNVGPAFSPQFVSDSASWTAPGYTVTATTGSLWRPGLIVSAVGIGAGNVNIVTQVSGNTISLQQPTTVSEASTVTLENQSDEGGTGLDCDGVNNEAQTCWEQRGNVAYGFKSEGAADTSFLVRPTKLAPLPLYGFRVDTRDNGCPSTAPFSVTNNTTASWFVDCGGNQTVSAAAGHVRLYNFDTAGVVRWAQGADNSAESGSNVGSNYCFIRYSDAGSQLDEPLCLNRQFGTATFVDSINQDAGIIAQGTQPVLTGTCTTSTQLGGMTAGSFHATCTSQTVIITFLTAAPNGWVCIAKDETTPTDSLNQTSHGVTSCTLTGSTAAADNIVFSATGF